MLSKFGLLYAKDIATAITEEVYLECNQKYKNIRSKQFYNYYQVNTKTNIPILSKFLIKNSDDNIVFNDDIYIKRVCYEKEKKLQEFNFKLLHGILPCGKNLMNWKIKDNNHCDVCNIEQTIIHLLFECRFVKNLWEAVSSALGWTIEKRNILYGSEKVNFILDNIIITITCFLIYKQWLVCSLENKNRSGELSFQNIISELEIRKSVYEKCNMIIKG